MVKTVRASLSDGSDEYSVLRYSGRMPCANRAVEYLRRHSEAAAALSCGGGNKRRCSSGQWCSRRGHTTRTIDEIHCNVGAGEGRRAQREPVLGATDGERDLLDPRHRLQFRVRRPHRGVQRHKAMHVVTQQPQVLQQGAGHVGQSAGLGVRQDLRTQNTQFQRRHEWQSSKRLLGIERKGAAACRVWQAKACDTRS